MHLSKFHSRLQTRLWQRGQATTEYALILLVAAVIAILVITWATSGDGGGKIGSLFDSIIDTIIDRATNAF